MRCEMRGIVMLVAILSGFAYGANEGDEMTVELEAISASRIGGGPLIHAGLHPSIGDNIQGPSLIKVPDWLENKLGNYYLYFADHKGAYIRLAYADEITGPWNIYPPGSLQLADSHFLTEPPSVTDEQADQVRAAFAKSGIEIPHDPVLEVTAPHIASPDVHVDHEPSMHVLRKGGFREWRRVEEYGVFPNLHPTRKLPAIEFELPLV